MYTFPFLRFLTFWRRGSQKIQSGEIASIQANTIAETEYCLQLNEFYDTTNLPTLLSIPTETILHVAQVTAVKFS